MNMEAGPLGEPVPDQRRLVGGVVSAIRCTSNSTSDSGIEKLAELQGPVAAVALKSGEEGRSGRT